MSDVLTVQSITKQFQRQRAVDGLSFSVRQGEIFALLGPNGAGKTTSIRMLLGMIRPDSGAITFAPELLSGEKLHPLKIGYLPEDRGLYREIPIQRTLAYMGALRGMSRADANESISTWLERLGLADRAGDKLEALSKGNQQKVQFVSAVLHQPEFAVLDEPFSGLDPINQDIFSDIIRELREKGMTVLLCAHQMDLVERLADRVFLMNRGREVLSGTMAQIRNAAATERKVVVTISRDGAVGPLAELDMVQKFAPRAKGEQVFFLKHGAPIQSFLSEAAKLPELMDIHTERISLHDIFVQSVGKDIASDTETADE